MRLPDTVWLDAVAHRQQDAFDPQTARQYLVQRIYRLSWTAPQHVAYWDVLQTLGHARSGCAGG